VYREAVVPDRRQVIEVIEVIDVVEVVVEAAGGGSLHISGTGI